MSQPNRTLNVSEEDIQAIIDELGLTPRPISGISQTVVSAARGVVPVLSNAITSFLLIDGSLSMDKWHQLVVTNYNDVYLAGLGGAEVAGSMLVGTMFFTEQNYFLPVNDPEYQKPLKLFHAPIPLEQAPQLTLTDFNPRAWDSNTPLIDAQFSFIEAVTAYTEQIGSRGKNVKTIFTLMTDGYENASRWADISAVRSDIRRLSDLGNYVPVFIGFGSNQAERDQFRQIALGMGFPEKNILTVVLDPRDHSSAQRELRRVFGTLSQQVVGVSKQTVADDEFFT